MEKIIEQLRNEAPSFFEQEQLDKLLLNAEARHQKFERRTFPSIKPALRWIDEMMKKKYKIYAERSNSSVGGHSVAMLKPTQLLTKELEELAKTTEQKYRELCDKKLEEWLSGRIEEACAEQKAKELAEIEAKEQEFKNQLLEAMRKAS